ncbi:hypothetical protein GE061_020124, partial [Apolygus lucorum]
VRCQDEIFEAYRQIGSELKHSLRAFESNNVYLSNKLSHLLHEVDVLKRTREIQKNTLVDLQIRAEKLDQSKQTMIRECLLDKNAKLETLNKEFGGVWEDEQYVTETHDKIRNLLENDKSEMEDFYDKVRQEHANQIKFSDEYGQNIDNLFKVCYQKVKDAIEEERNVELELEEALQQCKNTFGLKEKYEFELQEKSSNLELIAKEVSVLNDRVSKCKEDLNAILEENSKLKDEVVNSRSAHTAEQSKKLALIDDLEREIADKTTDLNEMETKLSDAMQENKYLSEQMETAVNQVRSTSTDVSELNDQIEELNKKILAGKFNLKELEDQVFELRGIHKIEERISSRKVVVAEKLTAQNSAVEELENKLRELHGDLGKANTKQQELKSAEEEMTMRNESAKKEVDGLLEELGELQVSRFQSLERQLSELKSKSQALKQQIEEMENRLNSASKEIAVLKEENVALDQELKEASVREEQATEKFKYFHKEQARLEVMKNTISQVKEELLKIKTSREFRVNVEQLKVEVQKVQREIDEKKHQHEAQKESIQESFKMTLGSLEKQMEKLQKASEEEMRSRQSWLERLHVSVPQLQQEIDSCKDDLLRTTRKNISMMRERLMVTNRLVESYRMLQAQSEKANGKDFTVVRLLGTIEEHLSSSFRGMIEYLQLAPVDLSSPSYFVYKRTLESFEGRFERISSESDKRLMELEVQAELKLAAFCLFGLRRYSAPSAASDSTTFSPASSSIRDF